MTELERFYIKVSPPNKDGCMNWIGAKHTKGYGHFSNKTFNSRIAHRIAYEINKGPIPEGMMVCHSCDNPSCVRSDHLWLGTARDNTQDMVKKGRGNLKKGVRFEHAVARPYSKLSEKDVIDIRNRVKEGITMVELSKQYKISDRTVNDIVNGRLWSSIDTEEDRLLRREAVKKTRSKCATINHSKLNVKQVKEIKIRLAKGDKQRDIGKDYNVSQFCIYQIKHGITWKDI